MFTRLFSDYGLLVVQFGALLLAFKINRKIEWLAPSLWIFLPLALSVILLRARLDAASQPVVALWKLLGALSAVYSLFHYPLIAQVDDAVTTTALHAVIVAVWLLSLLAGYLCFWLPGLSVLPPAFLIWSLNIAQIVSGLRITIDIDVQPLAEVSMCIGMGLLIHQIAQRWRPKGWSEDVAGFPQLLLLVAIAVHLANYYWSFVAKAGIGDSWLFWMLHNNPVGIFLTSLDDDHIAFAGYPALVDWLYWLIDRTYPITNVLIFVAQGAAITAFFLPRRWLVVLLISYDIMHLSIIVLVGANFWPWIVLNLIVAYIVARTDFSAVPLPTKLIATAFILLSPRFVAVAQLGWLDYYGVNNRLTFQAEDRAGTRHEVSTNFFTFYSYSIAHMDYGLPEPAIGLAVGAPNGGGFNPAMLQPARECDLKTLARGAELLPFNAAPLDRFVRNYHDLAKAIEQRFGVFPYDIYPHHFYVPLSVGRDFRELDKRDVVAYIYKQETVCLSFEKGRVLRKVMAKAEHRIDVQ